MTDVHITTCNKYRHLLPNFAKLFNKFWDEKKIVNVWGYLPPPELPENFIFHSLGEEDEPWSNQILKILEIRKEKHFILMAEDFYLLEPVNYRQLHATIPLLLTKYQPGRVSLQSVDDGYEGATFLENFEETDVYKIEKHRYKCSFEASVFNRDFLLRYMKEGETAHQAEMNTSQRASLGEEIVLLTKKPTLVYKDAVVGGNERIKFEDSKMMLAVPEGWKDTGITL